MEGIYTRLGGRKFLLAVAVLAIGVALEFLAPKGLTETMATFLAGVLAAFGVTNAVADFAARSPAEEQAPVDTELPTRVTALEAAASGLQDNQGKIWNIVSNIAKSKTT